VHELLNTIPTGRTPQPDLLGTPELAEHWLRTAVSVWVARTGADPPPDTELTERDLVALRVLRDQLRALASRAESPAGPRPSGALRLTLTGQGVVTAHPDGRGAGWVSSSVLGEVYLAQQHNSWQRLKICRNERCGRLLRPVPQQQRGVARRACLRQRSQPARVPGSPQASRAG
jgi:hypothetical protein